MKQVISIAIAVIVIAAIGYLLASERAAAPSEVNDAATNSEATSSAELTEATPDRTADTGTGTFADFFGSGENVYCTFSGDYDEGVSGEGEFWYANDKMRVEATTRVDGEVYTSNMINDGDKVYVWGGTAAGMQAMVMDADTAMNEDSTDSTQTEQAAARVDMQQRVQYECNPWSARDTQFVPPSDIEFVDMQAMMDGYFQGEMRGMPEGMNF